MFGRLRDGTRAYLGFGVTVETTAEFGLTLAQAGASDPPVILHLTLDPAALSPKLRVEGG